MTDPGIKTTAERYAQAQGSTDLTPRENPCDVDTLIAAGWVDECLGTRLLRLRNEFDAVRREFKRTHNPLTTSSLLPLLRSARTVSDCLMSYVDGLAARGAVKDTGGDDLGDVVHATLDAWLDPSCGACEGRGFNGECGAPIVLCTACRGSGARTVVYGRSYGAEALGRMLHDTIDRKTSYVEGRMRQFMRNRA